MKFRLEKLEDCVIQPTQYQSIENGRNNKNKNKAVVTVVI